MQQGFTVCEDMDDADVVYFYVQPKATNKAGASETEGVLSLVRRGRSGKDRRNG